MPVEMYFAEKPPAEHLFLNFLYIAVFKNFNEHLYLRTDITLYFYISYTLYNIIRV